MIGFFLSKIGKSCRIFHCLFLLLLVPAGFAIAQPPPSAGPAIKQAQSVPNNGPPQAPASLPPGTADFTGQISSVQAAGTAPADGSVFAQPLGSNGRSCATCHEASTAYSVTPALIQASFTATGGTGPLFRAIDGATCPSDNLSSSKAQQTAYSLLLSKGLFRVGLPMPANSGFAVSNVADPYGCTTSLATGLTSSTSGMVSVYRRPLPTTNLRFVSTLQWDGREPTLTQQATDAALIHEQAAAAPSSAQLSSIVAFETAHFTAQSFDNGALALNAAGASGGPVALSQSPSSLFGLYQPWLTLTGNDATTLARNSIARGEKIFNTRSFTITNVPGLTPAGPQGAVTGNCALCHTANRATVAPFLDIGVTAAAPPALNVTGLPVFTLVCQTTKQIFTVTDPGRALITGQCADIGKTKIPLLRGLAARAPFFHNGGAAQLSDVVNFYDQRFHIGLTAQDKADLVNYLGAL